MMEPASNKIETSRWICHIEYQACLPYPDMSSTIQPVLSSKGLTRSQNLPGTYQGLYEDVREKDFAHEELHGEWQTGSRQ